ncbi:pentatricopeptide repeat-containing protein At1g08070, chloroplastic [Cucurbita maxima]|uniref:Pentatricopeptide repeat-containing protein At1g08070, chloroplastic n=1 Tax=Cucurbita maxima TaxID=3661 RepID=A0A6J1JHE6_CUCMA|nr:pentatricopeptide repeat-containing protein At1g08070, chloroplastic [Cucurbita maxima]
MATSAPSLVLSPTSPSSDPPYRLLQDHPSLKLISKCRSIRTLRQIHAQIIKTGLHNTQFALSKLIEFSAVSRYADISYAVSLFNSIEEPNLFIWNSMIRGLSISLSPVLALVFFARMIHAGVEPNSYTFPFLLKSCARLASAREGKQIHAHVLKLGFVSDVFIHTSLINMYAQSGEINYAQLVFDQSNFRDAISFTALIAGYVLWGYMDRARKLFDEMPVRDVVSWNAMIAGYAQTGRSKEALLLFEEMRKANVPPNESTIVSVLSACAQSNALDLGNSMRSWIEDRGLRSNLKLVNALIDMYSKCGALQTARELFDEMPERDVISWNVMIGGYTHMCSYKEALALFREMLASGIEPTDITFLNVLPSCACLGAIDLGKWIHAYINKNFNSASTSLWTSLIDMYAKCGNIEAARQVFNGMNIKSLASWNAMICGLAMHGQANEALELFSKLTSDGIEPNEITFVGVLSACKHAGFVDLGRLFFSSMIQDYKISPKSQHYGCMIDLLGRAGLFEEAESLIQNMEMKPDGAIWGSLLGACRDHGRVELGEIVAERLFELEPDNPGAYVLLSNIYAGAGKWDDVATIRTKLNDKGMKKVPGCTTIEVDNVVHEFLVGDKVHPQSENIYKMLEEVDRQLKEFGFVPDTSEVLYDMDEEWKEGALSHHSEKLAIAFGLISTKPGTPITIIKNLRVCRNCHAATKLISKIFNREIIARDRNRFHHFKDGSCSCNDYW